MKPCIKMSLSGSHFGQPGTETACYKNYQNKRTLTPSSVCNLAISSLNEPFKSVFAYSRLPFNLGFACLLIFSFVLFSHLNVPLFIVAYTLKPNGCWIVFHSSLKEKAKKPKIITMNAHTSIACLLDTQTLSCLSSQHEPISSMLFNHRYLYATIQSQNLY